ncbi:hypothetical protein K8R32_03905 [bacterium]|nr:hypothetical protein [bacterium]
MSKSEKDLITLKQAAELSGYSADYIGQLIRSGKIPGKQVYSNITWMTTADAVVNYKIKSQKKKGKKNITEAVSSRKNKINLQISILKLFFKTFKSSIPILLVLIISFIVLVSFLVNLTFKTSEDIERNIQPKMEISTF